MLRILARIAAICAPLVAFIWWLLGPVQHHLHAEESAAFSGILYMLIGMAVLVLVEGLMIKFWLLPLIARAVSERFYAGSYLPENDPLARLVSEIAEHHRHDLLPELERTVSADPRRVRGWLELARLLEGEFADPKRAVDTLLRGAEALRRRKEDAALLIWRASTLSGHHPQTSPHARHIMRDLVSLYPDTTYGRIAAERLKLAENS